MRTNNEIAKIANGIYEEAKKSIATVAAVKDDAVEGLKGLDEDALLNAVSAIISDVETVVKASKVDGVGLPAFLSKILLSNGDTSKVTISIRTKLKSVYKYHKDTVVAVDEDFVVNAGKAYIDALFDMFYIEQAIANIGELNDKIASIVEQNEIPYTFSFAVNPNTDAVVLSIDNNSVVFNASISRAHDVSSLGIFASGDEYSDLICREETDKLIASLKSVQTPVQLVKANISIIKSITGITTKKRASKLIRGSYHRQAKYLNKVKSGVGYFNETVTIDGNDVDIFALVKKSEDGELSVVLNPFDVKTLFNVEYDVLSAVKEQLA